jgi:hypothetical protein
MMLDKKKKEMADKLECDRLEAEEDARKQAGERAQKKQEEEQALKKKQEEEAQLLERKAEEAEEEMKRTEAAAISMEAEKDKEKELEKDKGKEEEVEVEVEEKEKEKEKETPPPSAMPATVLLPAATAPSARFDGKVLGSAIPAREEDAPPADGVFVKGRTIATEEEWFVLLEASPLFKQLFEVNESISQAQRTANENAKLTSRLQKEVMRHRHEDAARLLEIENLLFSRIPKSASGGGTSSMGGVYSGAGGASIAYRDEFDMAFACEGMLDVVEDDGMNSLEIVAYKFGVFLLDVLRETMGHKIPTLLIAGKLPESDYEGNAFRNSYLYEKNGHVLFLRKECLRSMGDTLVIVLHAMAHVEAGDMGSDGNPRFLRELYKSMRSIGKELFFSRVQAPEVELRQAALSTDSALSTLLRDIPSSEDRSILQRLISPSTASGQPLPTADRLSQYTELSHNLAGFLQDLENDVRTSKSPVPPTDVDALEKGLATRDSGLEALDARLKEAERHLLVQDEEEEAAEEEEERGKGEMGDDCDIRGKVRRVLQHKQTTSFPFVSHLCSLTDCVPTFTLCSQ